MYHRQAINIYIALKKNFSVSIFQVITVIRFPALAPGPNLYFMAPAPNLYFTAPALNLHLSVLRFTVKVCYSYNVYLYKPYSCEYGL